MKEIISGDVKLSHIVLSFSRAISITLGMGLFHTEQLAKIAYLIGKQLRLSPKDLEGMVFSALLHDIGINSIKKDFSRISNEHESDFFKKSDMDILELLKFSRKNKINEVTDLIMCHSLEGIQFLKQSSLKDKVYKALKFGVLEEDSGATVDTAAYLSKILCVADLLECSTSIEDSFDQKAKTAEALVRSFSTLLFPDEISREILNIVKEKEFWKEITEKELFSELFVEFKDREYNLLSEELLKFLKLFARFIDIKSPHTAQHSTRTASISKLIAKETGFSDLSCELIYYSGLLHDVGKLAISNAIIDKPGKLTYAEYSTMKLHPKITQEILKPLEELQEVIFWTTCHHERMNGSGYPYGLDKTQIPIEGMIIAVADVYEALTADRPYRLGMNDDRALSILRKEQDLYNPGCIAALEKIIKEKNSEKLI
jgi:HD-GYP domain-containing protein (c-di-GMP phosphodiesterase class II)